MAKTMSTVVGIFLDQNWAQRAIQALQAAGFEARVADQRTVNNLTSMGIDNDAADLYKTRVGEGNSVVIVENAGNRGEDALGVMLQNGAENIDMSRDMGGTATAAGTVATTSRTNVDTNYDYNRLKKLDVKERQYGPVVEKQGRARNAEEMRIVLMEETLTPVKQARQAGEVELNKVVREEQKEIPVTLRHEEVTIERHAVDRPADPSEIGDMADQTITVPVYEERAELQKQARVVEEVTVGKRAQEEQQTLTGTVRHEELEVNKTGNVVRGTGATTGQWSQVMPQYRSHWEQSHANEGRWEDVEPAYRYGYEMRNNPQYKGRSYNDAESDLQSGWNKSEYGAKTAWNKVSHSVKDAWNDLTH